MWKDRPPEIFLLRYVILSANRSSRQTIRSKIEKTIYSVRDEMLDERTGGFTAGRVLLACSAVRLSNVTGRLSIGTVLFCPGFRRETMGMLTFSGMGGDGSSRKSPLGTDFLQYAISGITIGAIYAMVAIGYNAIYSVTEIINFAQGEFVMLGGLFAVFFAGTLHLPLYVAFLCAVVLTGCVGLAMDRLIIGRARDTSVLSLIIITLALSIMLKGSAMLWWEKTLTVSPHSVPVDRSGSAAQQYSPRRFG